MVEKSEILKLAKLSKLTLTEQDVEKLTIEMQSIIAFADMINNAVCEEETQEDATDVMPLREDIVCESYAQEHILRNAQTSVDGYFLLPGRQV